MPSGINFTQSFAAEAPVCRVTIVADDNTNYLESDVGSSGLKADVGMHSWLMFENISSSNITVGGLTIAPNKTITVGTWGNQPHLGVYYNLEAYYIMQYNKYSKRWSVSRDVTNTQLALMSRTIKDNDSWSLYDNCSSFATTVFSWSGQNISCGIIPTPKTTAISIRNEGGVLNANCPYYGMVYKTASNPIKTMDFKK